MSYLPLHISSGNSFLRSALTLRRIGGLANKYKFSHLSVVDFATCSGFPEVNKMAASIGAKPVFGMDVEIEGNLFSLFVQNEEGYQNLLMIDCLFSKEKLTLDALKQHSNGLAIVLASEQSFLRQTYLSEAEEIPSRLRELSSSFSSFRLGIPYLPDEKSFISFLRNFVEKYPYSTLAFPHVLYEKKEDAITLSILKAISEGQTIEQKEESGDNYLLSQEEADSFFTEEERKETFLLAKETEGFSLIKKRGSLLVFPNPLGISSEEYLQKLAFEGLEKKNPGCGEEYKSRLEYELKIIASMGYADYFLLVQDYVNYARSVGISVGPGRGSGAGSLVSYALDIVTPDPIKHGLLFERFLNPERQSMPDIDVDFADIRRDEVFAYLQEKYGPSRVAHIATTQTLKAKAAINDIGRVYNYEPRQIDLLRKAVNENMTLRENYRKNARFRKLVDSDRYYLQIVALAAKIEGLPRQGGLHPAGAIINDQPLEQCLPMREDPMVGYVSQYEKDYLEDQGFLKMDLLALRNLTTIDHALENVRKTHGIALNYRDIPSEDKDAIALIASGKTVGLFQLDTASSARAIRTLHPENFNDVVALMALNRPGPMDFIPNYARRKAGKEKISYLDPCLESILSPTYGIIVYQEQIMQMVQVLAGFSYGQADLFRRAISKKDSAKLEGLKTSFVEGCCKMGRSNKTAQDAFSLILRFADYGFNKSHSVCYAILACQMAYLKLHYPEEFYCALLDDCKLGAPQVLSEIKSSSIRLSLPSINEASTRFEAKGGAILLPITCIKGIQTNFVNALLDERMEHGPFEDYFSFVSRMYKKGLNEAILLKLIDAGCFDGLDARRGALRLASKAALKYAEVASAFDDQPSLFPFEIEKPEIIEIEENRMIDLAQEKEALGIMVSGSPLESKKERIQELGLLPLSVLQEEAKSGKLAAVVSWVKTIITKRGQKMAFLRVYDDTSEAEFTLFAEAYDSSYSALNEGNLVIVTFNEDERNPGKYIASKVETLS